MVFTEIQPVLQVLFMILFFMDFSPKKQPAIDLEIASACSMELGNPNHYLNFVKVKKN